MQQITVRRYALAKEYGSHFGYYIDTQEIEGEVKVLIKVHGASLWLTEEEFERDWIKVD